MHRAQPMQRPWGRNVRDVLRLELRENEGRGAGGDVRERMRDQIMSGLVGYCKNLASDFKDPTSSYDLSLPSRSPQPGRGRLIPQPGITVWSSLTGRSTEGLL